MVAAPGVYELAGQDAGLLADRILSLGTGNYSVTGYDSALLVERILATDPGAYLITGKSASILAGRLLDAAAGEYAVTGDDATLRLTDIVMVAESGVYVITGAVVWGNLDFQTAQIPSDIPSHGRLTMTMGTKVTRIKMGS